MANEPVSDYGYQEDEIKKSPFNFGLNAGAATLKTFEWIPNGGHDGAEQEALNIVFLINGTEKGYRLFPVTKAFGKNNVEITDPTAPEMIEAKKDLNAKITHIITCFTDKEIYKALISRPNIASFKEFVTLAASALPKNYSEIPLDIFMQYQWQISASQTRTYLELPKKMSYGKWLCRSIPNAKWVEHRVENPADNVSKALYYTNENTAEGQPKEHLFVKNGWFMNSNFAKYQKLAVDGEDNDAPIAQKTEGVSSSTADAAKASGW